ncbi:MAG: DUF6531 domain-containing protein [Agarilytica sp.]
MKINYIKINMIVFLVIITVLKSPTVFAFSVPERVEFCDRYGTVEKCYEDPRSAAIMGCYFHNGEVFDHMDVPQHFREVRSVYCKNANGDVNKRFTFGNHGVCPQGTDSVGSRCIFEPAQANPLLMSATNSCEAGSAPSLFNPINTGIGTKHEVKVDVQSSWVGGIKFARYYNSSNFLNGSEDREDGVGIGWRHTFTRKIIHQSAYTPDDVEVFRPRGGSLHFLNNGGDWISNGQHTYLLNQLTGAGGVTEGWEVTAPSGVIEVFDESGKLTQIRFKNQTTFDVIYNSYLQIDRVTSSLGDYVQFNYAKPHRISSVTTKSGDTISYAYDEPGHLTQVKYLDDTPLDQSDNPSITYHYEDSNFSHALTGISNEAGVRSATWIYDAQGRSISSSHAGGADTGTINYIDDYTTEVTNALGQKTIYTFEVIDGIKKVVLVVGNPGGICQ